MAGTRLAKRYAKSLLELGIENQAVDQIYADMKLVLDTVRSNKQLAVFFKSPIINTDKKEAVLHGLFENKMHKITLAFLDIIVRKKREYYVDDIASSFIELYKAHKNEQTAYLTTAVKIDDTIRKQMYDLIAKTTRDKIELVEKVDPSIIGGFILRWGDHQVDTSVTKKLHDLRQDFKDNLYQKDY
jgi:F-type H+-transporting ATPase subunit delta